MCDTLIQKSTYWIGSPRGETNKTLTVNGKIMKFWSQKNFDFIGFKQNKYSRFKMDSIPLGFNLNNMNHPISQPMATLSDLKMILLKYHTITFQIM